MAGGKWRDLAVAVAAGAVVSVGSVGAQNRLVPPMTPLDALGWLMIAVACSALVVRRRWPNAAFWIVAVAVVAYLAGHYPYSPIFLVLSVTMYGVAVRAGVTRSVVSCLAAYTATILAILAVELPVRVTDLVAYLGSMAVALGAPLLIGVITRLRVEAVAQRAYEERLAMAREVHDVVAHGLSVISMQSAGALHVFDSDPERARQALTVIRGASREALDELRGALGALRTGTAAETAGLGQVDALTARMASSGLDVSVDRIGRARALPPDVDTAAYRIVLESLTNVLRHASTPHAALRLEFGSAAVVVEVTDDGSGTPGEEGHGIAGMRERAARVGGTLRAGPRQEGGFAVRAVLPVAVEEGV